MPGVEASFEGIDDHERELAAFLSLKQENNSYELKRINGNFYVYLSSGKWNPETRKVKKRSIYKGRITPDGTFIPAKRTRNRAMEESAAEEGTTEAHTGSDAGPAPQDPSSGRESPHRQPLEPAYDERKALMILSMNGRSTPKMVGNLLGTSPKSAQYLVKKLETKYGIRYFADIAFWKFGLNQFVGFIKFESKRPSADEIRKALGEDPHVQLVALTSGEYDVFFYFLAESNDEAIDLVYKLETETKLAEYGMTLSFSYFYQNYGAIPVRPEFFELLEGKVWHRTKDAPTKKQEELWRREYVVLKELCRDGKMGFSEIDRRNGLEAGCAQYTFSRLKERGIVKRVTCTMQDIPLKYDSLIFVDHSEGGKFARNQNTLLANIASYTEHPSNKYAFMGQITSPNSLLLIAPVFENGENEAMLRMGRDVDGIKTRALVVTDILVGTLCHRLFDNDYSSPHGVLVQRGIVAPKAKTEYERTGRLRKKHVHVEKEQGIYGIRYE